VRAGRKLNEARQAMPFVYIDNVPMKHSMSPTELKGGLKQISSARAKTAAQLKLLNGAIKSGNASGQLALTSWLLQNPEALLTAAINANRKLKPSKRQPLEVVFNVAKTLKFEQALTEVVPVYPRPKASGGFRMIHNPGIWASHGPGRRRGYHRAPFRSAQLPVHPPWRPGRDKARQARDQGRIRLCRSPRHQDLFP
jgi:hypothetical protein